MKHRAWLSILLILCLLACLLAGCGSPFSDSLDYTRIHIEEGGDTLGLTPDFSYAVPTQLPGIRVNQLGFAAKEPKQAMLAGQELSPDFQVLSETGERVEFQGQLEVLGRTEEITMYGADFSSLEQPGSYVLFHPQLGYSDPFLIAEDVYGGLETQLLRALGESESKNTLELCYEVASLLLSQELYGKEGSSEVLAAVLKPKVEALLRAQDVTTGSVSGVIPEKVPEGETAPNISLSATAGFAGVMAMYGSYLQNTDYRYASQCTAAGERAYRFMEGSLETVSYDLGYFAAAQLYKKTGRARYSSALVSFLALKEEQRQKSPQDFSLFGDVAYLNTNFKTNLDSSRQIINGLMQEAEEISGAGSRMNYYVSEEREDGDVRGMLQDAMKIGVVNYVIANHEYSSLLKNYLHYFLGRNGTAVCYVEGLGERNPANKEEFIGGNEYGAMLYFLLESIY